MPIHYVLIDSGLELFWEYYEGANLFDVDWEKQPIGFYKLNVDGSARGEATSGGGIIRDHNGELVAAFSSFYGPGTSNSAEFNALYDGLRICQQLEIDRVIVESDSTVVISAIKKRYVEHWKLTYIFRLCVSVVGADYQFCHVVRQKNTVADRLANIAHSHSGTVEFFTPSNFPPSIRTAYRADLLGFWIEGGCLVYSCLVFPLVFGPSFCIGVYFTTGFSCTKVLFFLCRPTKFLRRPHFII